MRYIADAGCTEVEINADKGHLDPRIYPRGKLPKLRSLLEELSLHPNSVHVPIDGINLSTSKLEERRQAIKLLTYTLEYCGAIECSIAVVHPNHSDSLSIGTKAMKRNSVEALMEIVPRAEALGVKIALENMIEKEKPRFGSRVTDLIETIEEVGSSYLGVCIDTGHTNLSMHASKHDISLEDEIILAGERLWTLHINDNDGKEDHHWPPGDGNIDWGQVIRGLRKVNYKGVFMTEVAEKGDPKEFAKSLLLRTKEMLAKEWVRAQVT